MYNCIGIEIFDDISLKKSIIDIKTNIYIYDIEKYR